MRNIQIYLHPETQTRRQLRRDLRMERAAL